MNGDVFRRNKSVAVIAVLVSMAMVLMGCNGPHEGGSSGGGESVVFPQMVSVPGGTFTMGDNSSGNVEHQVTVSSFLMGKYEVTQKEWRSVMGSNPSYFRGDSLPVENVSWYDAVAYCNKLSEKAGLKRVYTVSGLRCRNTGTGFHE